MLISKVFISSNEYYMINNIHQFECKLFVNRVPLNTEITSNSRHHDLVIFWQQWLIQNTYVRQCKYKFLKYVISAAFIRYLWFIVYCRVYIGSPSALQVYQVFSPTQKNSTNSISSMQVYFSENMFDARKQGN